MKIFKAKVILFLFVLLTIGKMTAQESRFKEGETINVWAASGLNMRDKPDAKGQKLATIPYGAKVLVQTNIGVKVPFEIEEFKGFTVKGYWLLVKYGNTEGFVFDGFLSRLPIPKNTKSTKPDEPSGIADYLKTLKKVGKVYDIEKCKELDFLKDTCVYKQRYEYGIVLKDIIYPEVGGGFDLTIPNISLYEGYFLIKFYYFDEGNDKCIYDAKKKTVGILPQDEGVGCHSDIYIKNNVLIIENYCGC